MKISAEDIPDFFPKEWELPEEVPEEHVSFSTQEKVREMISTVLVLPAAAAGILFLLGICSINALYLNRKEAFLAFYARLKVTLFT